MTLDNNFQIMDAAVRQIELIYPELSFLARSQIATAVTKSAQSLVMIYLCGLHEKESL